MLNTLTDRQKGHPRLRSLIKQTAGKRAVQLEKALAEVGEMLRGAITQVQQAEAAEVLSKQKT